MLRDLLLPLAALLVLWTGAGIGLWLAGVEKRRAVAWGLLFAVVVSLLLLILVLLMLIFFAIVFVALMWLVASDPTSGGF